MAAVYVRVNLIVPVGADEQIMDVLEFVGEDWMAALDAAYDWLKGNRKPSCVYHVYC